MANPTASSLVPSGPELFARYAYPPNELGYCGPEDSGGLLVRGNPEATAEIGRRARAFEGAWVYLELIAEAAGISDPLDARVVEAYWLGSDLLDLIDSAWFLAALQDRFRGQTGGQWAGGVPDLEAAVAPHHAFHVFAIYPWVGLLRGDNDLPRSILDQCRIRTGVVEAVRGESATVRTAQLTWDGRRLEIGRSCSIEARWSEAGHALIAPVHEGDVVSVHWDWICDVVTPAQADTIQAYEARQLAVTNRVLELSAAH